MVCLLSVGCTFVFYQGFVQLDFFRDHSVFLLSGVMWLFFFLGVAQFVFFPGVLVACFLSGGLYGLSFGCVTIILTRSVCFFFEDFEFFSMFESCIVGRSLFSNTRMLHLHSCCPSYYGQAFLDSMAGYVL